MGAQLERHQQELERYYQKQVSGRKIFWRDKYKPYLSLYRDRRLKRDAEILAALPPQLESVADIGCGHGDLLSLLAPRAKQVIGLDLAEVMVETARQNLAAVANVRVECSPAETLPFADGSMQAVILGDVIEHLVDPPGSLAEIKRALKPGGWLVITTPNAKMEFRWKRLDAALNAPFRRLRRSNQSPSPTVLEHLYTREQLNHLASEAGFRIVQHRLIEFYPGSEGGGTFKNVLRLIARQRQMREWLVEPFFRAIFGWIERRERFNNRQLLVLQKP